MIVEWVLPDDLSAARAARTHVADALARHGVPDPLADDMVLVASELASNAIRHGGPPALLRLEHSDGRIRITVSSHGGTADPTVLDAGTEAGHGRGLAIVQTLATDVGWQREGDRVDVWAEFPVS